MKSRIEGKVKHSRSEAVAWLSDLPVEELNSWTIDELKQLNRQAAEKVISR